MAPAGAGEHCDTRDLLPSPLHRGGEAPLLPWSPSGEAGPVLRLSSPHDPRGSMGEGRGQLLALLHSVVVRGPETLP